MTDPANDSQRFKILVDSVQDYAIFMLDAEGCIRSWNVGAAAIHGYSPQDVLGRHFSQLSTPEDAEEQGWRMRKNGERFWADVVLTPVHDSQGGLLGFAEVTRDLTTQRRLAELEHSSRPMSEFLSMLAHELRNPLAPIRNAVSVLATMDPLPARVAGFDAHLTKPLDVHELEALLRTAPHREPRAATRCSWAPERGP